MVEFDILRAESLGEVPHGFFGSSHGAHQFGYGGPGSTETIFDRRAAAANAIVPGGTIAAPHQVHSADVLTVLEPWHDGAEGRPMGDAVVTNRVGIVLAIVTADCAPVLLADKEAGVVAAAHAGWRGAVGGVLENTITAMVKLGALHERIKVVIGPTIGRDSYEVDNDFCQHFEAWDADHFYYVGKREGKDRWLFDLPGYIFQRLERAGISTIEDIWQDTFVADPRYYSYRRATKEGKPNYGRQISMIALG